VDARLIAALILLPFAAAFIYAAIQEYMRYKSQGKANYGLVYDEETGTTHVTGLGEGQDEYNPDDFDPSDSNQSSTESDESKI
jgi:UPF0716 family protein affecting phage T7 exclusion